MDENSTTIEDTPVRTPNQLDFFYLLEPNEVKYSNTIELYDAIPKYVWQKKKSVDGRLLTREFTHRGQRYKVTVKPALIENKEGDLKYIYPGVREELVEDALRKIACEGHGTFSRNQFGVIFSLYRLQEELRVMKHSYSLDEIKEALHVCRETVLKLNWIVDEVENESTENLFNTLGLRTQEDWRRHGNKTKAMINFHPLVTKSILDMTFRAVNYESLMAYKMVLSRWIHKKMSHNYTQASMDNDKYYQISLDTIIEGAGIKKYQSLSNNIREIEKALKELVKNNTLRKFDHRKSFDEKDKRKITGAVFRLFPSKKFVDDTIKANTRLKIPKRANEFRKLIDKVDHAEEPGRRKGYIGLIPSEARN